MYIYKYVYFTNKQDLIVYRHNNRRLNLKSSALIFIEYLIKSMLFNLLEFNLF